MQLEGIHHITAITSDAQRNLDFYVEVMGLRFVKRTVNHDQPEVYHLYYADQDGKPGSVLTFFEYRDSARGRAGAGMVHTLMWQVGSSQALDFWEKRLEHAGRPVERGVDCLRTSDPEELQIEFVHSQEPNPILAAQAKDIPSELALQGFYGARAYSANPQRSAELLQALKFQDDTPNASGTPDASAVGSAAQYTLAGKERHAKWSYDHGPQGRGVTSAGTVHHIAWASQIEDHLSWREAAISGGAFPTEVIDRLYFRSIYFREPSGVLFEIATLGPGFAVDEPADHLGESLVLPPRLQSHREELEKILTPLKNPRQ